MLDGILFVIVTISLVYTVFEIIRLECERTFFEEEE